MITLEQVKELFRYDPLTGDLYWQISPSKTIRAGAIAGSINGQGYREVMFRGKTYQVSRIIWLIMTGEWPKGQVDHKNLSRAENWWDNLRDSTESQNRSNCRARANNSTGFKGIGLPDKKNGKYYPYIQVNKKKIRLGGFHTPEEAHAAWVEAAKKYRGEFARGS